MTPHVYLIRTDQSQNMARFYAMSLQATLLAVLGGLAEFERELIKSRTSEGRKRAKERGQAFGPKRKLTPFQQQQARERKAAGEPVRDIARSYNVSASTISRLL